jgi:hypothetical protein
MGLASHEQVEKKGEEDQVRGSQLVPQEGVDPEDILRLQDWSLQAQKTQSWRTTH